MGDTKIEWTRSDDGTLGKTWNPTRGCSKVSPGCKNCYAATIAARFSDPGQAFNGYALRKKNGAEWTGKVSLLDEKKLIEPWSWREPRRVFVNSMSDLFHENLSNEDIAVVFMVMHRAWKHTFQILTKRAKRMGEWYRWAASHGDPEHFLGHVADDHAPSEFPYGSFYTKSPRHPLDGTGRWEWPFPNIWVGVSVEDQTTADERIPWLLDIPAPVRFLSCEPLLEAVDLENVHPYYLKRDPSPFDPVIRLDCLRGHMKGPDEMLDDRIGWVICGGESGPGSRPFELAWARSLRDQCKGAGVPFFMKQLGAAPRREVQATESILAKPYMRLKSRKGGDMSEWPRDLRIQEFPEVRS